MLQHSHYLVPLRGALIYERFRIVCFDLTSFSTFSTVHRFPLSCFFVACITGGRQAPRVAFKIKAPEKQKCRKSEAKTGKNIK